VAKRKQALTTRNVGRPAKSSSTSWFSRLNSKSAFARSQAAERLGTTGSRRAIAVLENRLTDASPEVRMRVVEALGNLTTGTHHALASALNDTDELVRLQAAESIRRGADARTVSALRAALDDPSPLVRSYVAAALGRAGIRSDRTVLRACVRRESSDAPRLGLFEGLWLLGDRRVFVPATQLLNSGDYRVRCATARALATTFRSPRTERRIVMALRSRLHRERTNAVRQALSESLDALGQNDRADSRSRDRQ
jgi:HEAT repeat protein